MLLGDELAILIKQGKCKKVQSIVKDHPNDSLIDSYGRNPFHLASKYNQIELIRFFIQSEQEIDIEDALGMTPIVTALLHNNFHAAKILHYAHLEAHVRHQLFESVDENAVYSMQRKDTINALVAKMRKIGLSSNKIGDVLAIFDCPLELVILFNNALMTQGYLQSKSKGNKYYSISIADDMFEFDYEHVKVLLEYGSKIGHVSQVCFVLIKNILNYQKSKKGRDFLKKLLCWSIFKKRMLKYLEISLKTAQWDNIKIFLKYDFYKVSKAQCGQDILAGLYANSDPKVTRFLKKKGVNVNTRYYINNTALHYAAENHVINHIQLLLDKGADPNALNKLKETPLHVALKKCDQGNLEKCLKILLINGANILLLQNRLKNPDFKLPGGLTTFEWNMKHMNIVKLFLSQLAICQAQGLSNKKTEKFYKKLSEEESVHNRNTAFNEEMESYFEECHHQLKILQTFKIRDDQNNQGTHKIKFTMFEILAEKPEKNARYVSEEDLQTITTYLKCNRKKLHFYYRQALKQHAKDIIKINSNRCRAIGTTCMFSGIQDIHHLVIEKIFSYLTAKDLLNFNY